MSSTRAPKNTQMYDVHDAFSGVLLGKGVQGYWTLPLPPLYKIKKGMKTMVYKYMTKYKCNDIIYADN